MIGGMRGVSRNMAGVTLLESMVTLAVAAILATTALPGLVDMVRDVRRDGHLGDLVGALSLARSEAVRRGTRVTICPSQNGEKCLGEGRWETGWMVFADANGNERVDGDEQLLRYSNGSDVQTTLRGARTRIVYRGDGFSAGYTDTFRVCDARGLESARSLILSNTGRARLKTGATACP